VCCESVLVCPHSVSVSVSRVCQECVKSVSRVCLCESAQSICARACVCVCEGSVVVCLAGECLKRESVCVVSVLRESFRESVLRESFRESVSKRVSQRECVCVSSVSQ